MIITGKVFKYGDDVSTDLIFPGRYTYLPLDEEQMAEYAMADLDPDFGKKETDGGIVCGGYNWGCGSAREQAVKSLKAKGIRAVLAKGIARIYYRNCINEGLLPIVCPEAADAVSDGDEITINTETSRIYVKDMEFVFPEFPPFVMDIISAGGLIEGIKKEFEQSRR